jgi:hypothetical protein
MKNSLKLLIRIVICWILVVEVYSSAATESVRTQEINHCLNGKIMTWGDEM